MLATERRMQILEYLKEKGSAEVSELSATFGVSEVTIRRDLDELARRNLIIRVHGGAVPYSWGTSFEPLYDSKKGLHVDEKSRIGAAAAQLVHDGETIILDSGTTTWQIANKLRSRYDLTVVTTDLNIAGVLSINPTIRVIIAGGLVRPGLFCCVGPYTEELLNRLNVDKTFLGADAISVEKGVTNATVEEVPVKQAMIRAGHQVILVADHSKFQKVAFAKVADLSQIDCIITDNAVPDKVIQSLRDMKIEVRAV